jgi:hypothetical protein
VRRSIHIRRPLLSRALLVSLLRMRRLSILSMLMVSFIIIVLPLGWWMSSLVILRIVIIVILFLILLLVLPLLIIAIVVLVAILVVILIVLWLRLPLRRYALVWVLLIPLIRALIVMSHWWRPVLLLVLGLPWGRVASSSHIEGMATSQRGPTSGVQTWYFKLVNASNSDRKCGLYANRSAVSIAGLTAGVVDSLGTKECGCRSL